MGAANLNFRALAFSDDLLDTLQNGLSLGQISWALTKVTAVWDQMPGALEDSSEEMEQEVGGFTLICFPFLNPGAAQAVEDCKFEPRETLLKQTNKQAKAEHLAQR